MIKFGLNGELTELEDVDPTMNLLDWLRYEAWLTGTKEGCAEGDCGACTVVVGELRGDQPVYRAVNACTLFMPMVDGRDVVTVEHLSADGDLHPVQEAMVSCHATQCGFCTPGIVMTLFADYEGLDPGPKLPTEDLLAGNLCRCTGYGPILKAAEAAEAAPTAKRLDSKDGMARLRAASRTSMLSYRYQDPVLGDQKAFFAPRTLDELDQVLAAEPEATLIAGATDVALWVNKDHRTLPVTVSLNDIAELRAIDDQGSTLIIGAGVRYSDAWESIASLYPSFGEMIRRLGAVQVRNAGTLGGNIANGSPIGDSMPPLIALGAKIRLRKQSKHRELPLEELYLDYQKQAREPGEIVEAVIVPKPAPGQHHAVYKISKRFDQDISAVCGAFSVTLTEGKVTAARVAFGGMAATPKRAKACETALIGQPWTDDTIQKAQAALAGDFSPISDMRASSGYRMLVAENLLTRFFLETKGQAAPSLGQGGLAHA
ncbi:MAG: xanthine dehydrogenase small subunit [Pseudomonadota bacterium]